MDGDGGQDDQSIESLSDGIAQTLLLIPKRHAGTQRPVLDLLTLAEG